MVQYPFLQPRHIIQRDFIAVTQAANDSEFVIKTIYLVSFTSIDIQETVRMSVIK